jgi:ATP-dependent Clp protease ATP-binding subunit ClpA
MEISTRQLIEVVGDRAPSQDPLVLLDTAVEVAGQVGGMADAMVDHYVGAARAAGLSWTVIGDRLGVSKQAARQRFSTRLEAGMAVVGELPALAPRLEACIEVARAAAEAEGSVAGTQHLLLGLLQVGVAANVLDRLGVSRDAVKEASGRLLAGRDAGAGDRVIGDGEAESKVTAARRFAAERGQNETRTEHLLMVVALDPGSSARRVLDSLGVEPARVKKELADMIPPSPRAGRRRGRRTGKPDRDGVACSFCGCSDADRVMVSGPGVRICSECVVLATEIVKTGDAHRMRG